MDEKYPDLFGGETMVVPELKPRGPYQEMRLKMGYRNAAKDATQRCGSCKRLYVVGSRTRTYFKCKLLGVSNSKASDIRLKGVCNEWKPK